MCSVYLTNKLARPTSWEDWKGVRDMMDFVVANHATPDASIWEVRGMSQNYLYSKIMMWVALDRGLRLADKRSFPCPKRAEWLATRDLIYEEVMEKGWNEEKGHFGQSYENTEALDASVMVMRKSVTAL
jgi:GH15 family glucan-1,4-alpha-glucosidase